MSAFSATMIVMALAGGLFMYRAMTCRGSEWQVYMVMGVGLLSGALLFLLRGVLA